MLPIKVKTSMCCSNWIIIKCLGGLKGSWIQSKLETHHKKLILPFLQDRVPLLYILLWHSPMEKMFHHKKHTALLPQLKKKKEIRETPWAFIFTCLCCVVLLFFWVSFIMNIIPNMLVKSTCVEDFLKIKKR